MSFGRIANLLPVRIGFEGLPTDFGCSKTGVGDDIDEAWLVPDGRYDSPVGDIPHPMALEEGHAVKAEALQNGVQLAGIYRIHAEFINRVPDGLGKRTSGKKRQGGDRLQKSAAFHVRQF